MTFPTIREEQESDGTAVRAVHLEAFGDHGRVVAQGTPLAVSRQILGSDALDAASMEEVFLKISREGAA